MNAVRTKVTRGDARSDTDLLGLTHLGDREALGALYDRHAQSVFAFARRLTQREDAEDVVQATFLRIAEIAGSYDDRSLSARAWIFGVAYRIVRERRRSLHRLLEVLRRYAERESARSVSPSAGAHDLERALAALAEPKRVVLLLTELHGLSCEEVARTLDVPIGTVWTRLHHARREMRALLQETP